MIPRIIHYTWKDEESIPLQKIWSADGEDLSFQDCLNSFTKFNPNWRYIFWSDRDIDILIGEIYPNFYPTFKKLKPIEKVDFFRYVCLFRFGGLFVDLDCFCARPLDEILHNNDYLIVGLESTEYTNWLHHNYHQQLQIYAIFAEQDCSILGEIIYRVINNCKYFPNRNVIEKTSMAVFGDIVYQYKNKEGVRIMPIDFSGCSGNWKHLREYSFGPNMLPSYILHCGAGTWKTSEFHEYGQLIAEKSIDL